MTTFSRSISALVLAISLAVPAAGAQELIPSTLVGSRVRVSIAIPRELGVMLRTHDVPSAPGVPPAELTGVLTARSPEALYLRTHRGRDWGISAGNVRAVEVSRGRRSRVRQALLYGLAGAAVGTIVASVASLADDQSGKTPAPARKGRLGKFVPSFGALGIAVGALHPGERWEMVYRRD